MIELMFTLFLINFILLAVVWIISYFLIAPRKKWEYPHSASIAIVLFFFLLPISLILNFIVFAGLGICWLTLLMMLFIAPFYSLATSRIIYEMAKWYEKERRYE